MKRGIRIVLGILAAVILIGAVTFCVSETLVIRASKGQNYDDADYIIVLGAKVDPWGPSRALDDRLRAALAYLEDHPGCKAVVTGGQG
ncbi:MAG: YdcF family protein, partial [Firmicutes bacterium]|nr:YdcF family protein [Bacillota bacterium]